MPSRVFLETYPLYRKFKIELPPYLLQIDKPAIHMSCEVCKSDQTFNMVNKYAENCSEEYTKASGNIVRALYRCSSCGEYFRWFFILISTNSEYIMKVGQHPAWEISIDRNLEKMLGDHADYYRKGLICESQGYGIGAFAYYRRIVEQIIDQLLIDITELIPDEEHEHYIEALEKVKKP
jgi:hypothetical protein